MMFLVPSCRISWSFCFFLHFVPSPKNGRKPGSKPFKDIGGCVIIYFFQTTFKKFIVPNLLFQKSCRSLPKSCHLFPRKKQLPKSAATTFLSIYWKMCFFRTSEDCDLDFEFLGLQEGQVKVLWKIAGWVGGIFQHWKVGSSGNIHFSKKKMVVFYELFVRVVNHVRISTAKIKAARTTKAECYWYCITFQRELFVLYSCCCIVKSVCPMFGKIFAWQ